MQEDNGNVNQLPFLKHDDRGKDYDMMASHYEGEVIEGDDMKQESALDVDRMAQ